METTHASPKCMRQPEIAAKIVLEPLFAKSEISSIRIQSNRFQIGRSRECDHYLSSPLISRHHCELSVEGGAFWVRDLCSQNGTSVNGKQVGGHLVELKDGDELWIATTPFVVHIQRVNSHVWKRLARHDPSLTSN